MARPTSRKTTRFEAELVQGHKGVTAIIVPFDPEEVWRMKPVRLDPRRVPFDPEEVWRMKPVRLDPRRDGWLVKGKVNSVPFEGYIGLRWGRFFLMIGPELREKADVSVGDTLELELQPTLSRSALEIAREQSKLTTAPKKGRADAIEL